MFGMTRNSRRFDDRNETRLEYKSAYNYDRTFHSKPTINPYPSTNIPEKDEYRYIEEVNDKSTREYLVSEEDYILLRKIKQEREAGNKVEMNIPSRGRPRGISRPEEVAKHVEDDEGPKLPPRKPKESKQADPYQERFERYTKSKTKLVLSNDKYNDDIENEDEDGDEGEKPALPKRTKKPEHLRRLSISREGSIKESIRDKSHSDSKPMVKSKPEIKPRERNITTPIVKSEGSHPVPSLPVRKPEVVPRGTINTTATELQSRNEPKPLPILPPQPHKNDSIRVKYSQEIELIELSSEDEQEEKENENVSISSKIPPKVNRGSKPLGFIDSLQGNKLTTSNINQNDFPPLKSTQPSPKHLDYLDSMQDNSTTVVSSKISTLSSSSPPRKNSPTRIPKSESFIESALKNSESSHNLSLKQKPLLPNKPKNLTTEMKKQDQDKKPKEGTLEIPALRKVDKPASQSPTRYKSERIDLPKLQKKVPPAVNKTSKPSTTIDFPKLSPVKKTPPPVKKDNKPSLPEALLKRNNLNDPKRSLNKSKTVPIIPERKISMPEALQKAKQLRGRGGQVEEPQREKPLTIEDKLSSVIALQKRHTIPGSTIMRSESINSSRSNSSSSQGASLSHPTKRRAKGPKRKLPTKI